jgi:hypothetical protein
MMMLRCALGLNTGGSGSLRPLALAAAASQHQQCAQLHSSSLLLGPAAHQPHHQPHQQPHQQQQQHHARLRAQQPPALWAPRPSFCNSSRPFASEASGADSSSLTTGFANLPRNATVSGYPQAADAAAVAAAQEAAAAAATTTSSSSSSGITPPRPTDPVQLPPEVLRVALRREEAVEEAAEQVDAYSISR